MPKTFAATSIDDLMWERGFCFNFSIYIKMQTWRMKSNCLDPLRFSSLEFSLTWTILFTCSTAVSYSFLRIIGIRCGRFDFIWWSIWSIVWRKLMQNILLAWNLFENVALLRLLCKERWPAIPSVMGLSQLNSSTVISLEPFSCTRMIPRQGYQDRFSSSGYQSVPTRFF